MKCVLFRIILMIGCIVSFNTNAEQFRDTARFMLPFCKQTHRYELVIGRGLHGCDNNVLAICRQAFRGRQILPT